MGGLKDQLLKAGLVNEKQVKRAQQEGHKEKKQLRAQGKPAAGEEEQRRLLKAQAEKAERDRQLNQQRQEQAEQKARHAQIKQLIEAHRLSAGDGDQPFNFVDGGAVKRLFVSEAVRKQLVRGAVAIVKLEDRHELVPAEVAEKIRARNEAAVVLWNAPAEETEPKPADDPYADFQVPDDLVW